MNSSMICNRFFSFDRLQRRDQLFQIADDGHTSYIKDKCGKRVWKLHKKHKCMSFDFEKVKEMAQDKLR